MQYAYFNMRQFVVISVIFITKIIIFQIDQKSLWQQIIQCTNVMKRLDICIRQVTYSIELSDMIYFSEADRKLPN